MRASREMPVQALQYVYGIWYGMARLHHRKFFHHQRVGMVCRKTLPPPVLRPKPRYARRCRGGPDARHQRLMRRSHLDPITIDLDAPQYASDDVALTLPVQPNQPGADSLQGRGRGRATSAGRCSRRGRAGADRRSGRRDSRRLSRAVGFDPGARAAGRGCGTAAHRRCGRQSRTRTQSRLLAADRVTPLI